MQALHRYTSSRKANLPSFAQNGCLFTRFSNDNSNLRMQIADLILIEVRKGIASNTEVRWLVSCKHKAHSGSSVSKTDEPEIFDSLKAHNCTGFIGFYSTLPSSGLVTKVENIQEIEHQFFDSSKIEQALLTNANCLDSAKRYFPKSFKNWVDENPKPAQIFADHEPFRCHLCESVLDFDNRGIVISWSKYDDTDGYGDEWAELRDYFTPTIYLRAVMGFCNQLNDPKIHYSEEAFSQEKSILIKAYPYVCRNLTQSEVESVRDLVMIPRFLGGLG